jgi:hypothetical protein
MVGWSVSWFLVGWLVGDLSGILCSEKYDKITSSSSHVRKNNVILAPTIQRKKVSTYRKWILIVHYKQPEIFLHFIVPVRDVPNIVEVDYISLFVDKFYELIVEMMNKYISYCLKFLIQSRRKQMVRKVKRTLLH